MVLVTAGAGHSAAGKGRRVKGLETEWVGSGEAAAELILLAAAAAAAAASHTQTALNDRTPLH